VMLAALACSLNVASAAPGGSQACTSTDNFGGFFASHGACVSALETFFSNGNAGAVGFCKVYDNLGLPNQGQCVSTLRHFGF